MKVRTRSSVTFGSAAIRKGVEIVRKQSARLSIITIALGLWLMALVAIAGYWRSEVPAVRAVGARATVHKVVDWM